MIFFDSGKSSPPIVYSTPQNREISITGTDSLMVNSAMIRNASIGIWNISFVRETVTSFLHITEKNLFILLPIPEQLEATSGRFLLILNNHPFNSMCLVLECLYNTPYKLNRILRSVKNRLENNIFLLINNVNAKIEYTISIFVYILFTQQSHKYVFT